MKYEGNLLLSDDGIDYENQWVLFTMSRSVKWMLWFLHQNHPIFARRLREL